MGMYTELVIACELKRETPQEIIDNLNALIAGESLPHPQNAPAFMHHWPYRNPLTGSSYYFPCSHATLNKREFSDYALDTRANIKNYESEIEAFLDWLKPWVDHGSGSRDLWAMTHYEEDDEPKLYYLKD